MKNTEKTQRLELIKQISARHRAWDEIAKPPTAAPESRMQIDVGAIQYIEQFGKCIRPL